MTDTAGPPPPPPPSGVPLGPEQRWRKPLLGWLWRAAAAWVGGTVWLVLLLRFVDPPTTALIVERTASAWWHGKSTTVHQKWVPLSAISPNLQLAVIASEDQKFPTHFGFDAEAIAGAVETKLEGGRLRGASTLTQQVAKNLFLWPGRSFVRKALEAYFTVLLELLWSKHRILEVHLNVAEWGNGVYGAEAASRTWFGTGAARLSPAQAAALAATLPNPRARRPNAPSALVQERAVWVEDQARHLGTKTLQGL